MTRFRTSACAPWTGLFVGAAAWFLQHQVGGDANFWDCHAAGGPFLVGLGVVCALAAAAGGWVSWTTPMPEEGDLAQNRRFARLAGTGAAGIFLLAIAFQTLAGVLVPACHR